VVNAGKTAYGPTSGRNRSCRRANKGMRMAKKNRLLGWISLVTLLLCGPASAQEAYGSGQAGTTAHNARAKSGSGSSPSSEAPANPLLGAPRDYEESYLSSLGIMPLQTDGAARNSEQSTTESPISPVFGAPEDYEDSYLAQTGSGRHEQGKEAQSASYGLTPIEEQISPETLRQPRPSSANPGVSKKSVGLRIETRHRDDRTTGSAAESTGLPLPQPFSAPGAQASPDAASAVYRSPW
jgi:hypothetical protein